LVCDINPRMLEVGEKRAQTVLSPSEQTRIDWLEGDAENLSTIPDNSFDIYTIAFGIRNCVHVDRVSYTNNNNAFSIDGCTVTKLQLCV
jgi:2-methoxy-6-polyprenyl-1,4-benzoquinol methylase